MNIREKSTKTILGASTDSAPVSEAFFDAMSLSATLPPATSPLPEPATHELLVQFAAGTGSVERAQALAAISGKQRDVLWTDGDGGALLRVELSASVGIDEAIEMLLLQPGVKFAEANVAVSVLAVSNDPQYTNGVLWGLHGDTSGSPYGSGADQAWAAGHTGSASAVVGVIDTGIDYRHQDLYLNIWLNQDEISTTLGDALADVDSDGLITFRDLNDAANQLHVSDLNANGYIDAGDLLSDTRWENGVDDDDNAYIDDLIGWDFANNDNDPLDDEDHGTHVAGTIGGIGGNGAGVVGVNWSTQMVALKILSSDGNGTLADALRSLDYYTDLSMAAAGDFIGTNNSWGGGGFSQSLLDGIARTGAAGNLFVAAAGNGDTDQIGDDNDTQAFYPSTYSTQGSLGWDAVVAVASMDQSGALSSFSNYGNLTVDLAAPGSSIQSTLRDGAYGTLSGTSMATPHVMGALALISSALPNATPQDCLAILMQCVTYKADLADQLAWNGWLDISKLQSVLDDGHFYPLVASLTISDALLNSAETATVTVTFSEEVAGFSNDDVTLSLPAGTLGEFTSTDNLTWVSTLTPEAGMEVQGVDLTIAAGSYTSLDGIRPGQAYTSDPFAVDTSAPMVTITLLDSELTSGESVQVSFVFSEVVTGFTSADVIAENGGITDLDTSDGLTWTATFTPATGLLDTENRIAIDAGSYTDIAGNAGGAGLSANYTIDTTLTLRFGTDGNDTLLGTEGDDIISGVPAVTSLYGRGSIDTLTGTGGSDVFVLGRTGRLFYNDGLDLKAGEGDYALITDFTAGVDEIQLASGWNYVYSTKKVDGISGLGIYWDGDGDGRANGKLDELIGLLMGVTTLSAADVVMV